MWRVSRRVQRLARHVVAASTSSGQQLLTLERVPTLLQQTRLWATRRALATASFHAHKPGTVFSPPSSLSTLALHARSPGYLCAGAPGDPKHHLTLHRCSSTSTSTPAAAAAAGAARDVSGVGVVTIGDVSAPVRDPEHPELVPHGYYRDASPAAGADSTAAAAAADGLESLAQVLAAVSPPLSQTILGHLRWMMQKDQLGNVAVVRVCVCACVWWWW